MSIRDVKGKVMDRIPIETVLVSVSDKTGLDDFVPRLIGVNPDMMFLSTGGTYKAVREILGDSYEDNLVDVSEYTGFPEMEGGLVKTLHPKIHAGILAERGNPAHEAYLADMDANYIDMVVVNLYPFERIVSNPGTTFEEARGNIDIGGPTMLRAAAKNFLGCAPICDPKDYEAVIRVLEANDGTTGLKDRVRFAARVFEETANYEESIDSYFSGALNGPGGIDKILAQYDI